MITQAEKDLIIRSWRLVVPIADTAGDLFYRRLFELRPDYRTIFPENLTEQKRKLVTMLNFIVKSLDWPESAWEDDVNPEEDLFLVVLALGRRHSELYHTPDEAYGPVGEALLWTLDYAIGKEFDGQLKAAWAKVYTLVSKIMKMGSKMIAERDASPASSFRAGGQR